MAKRNCYKAGCKGRMEFTTESKKGSKVTVKCPVCGTEHKFVTQKGGQPGFIGFADKRSNAWAGRLRFSFERVV